MRMGNNDNNTNWLQLLKELEREDMVLRSSTTMDADTAKDLNWIMKHPGVARDVSEARAKRQAREAQIRHEAAKIKQALMEQREQVKKQELEALTLAHADDILLSIDGQRVKKFKKMDDLKCPHCGEPSSTLQGIAMNAAEDLQHRAEQVRAGRGSPYYNIHQTKCEKCRKPLTLRCQVVIL